MSEYYKEIAEKIDSGEYFKDAKEWYLRKYISPYIEQTFLLFLTIASIAISFVGINVLYNFFPLAKKVPIIVKIDDESDVYPRISHLAKKDEKNSNEILIKWILTKFIKSYEIYDPRNNFQSMEVVNKRFLQIFSSKNLQKKYYDYALNPNNPRGMKLKYRINARKQVGVHHRSFKIMTKDDKSANVKKTLFDIFRNQGDEKGKYYTAEVDFDTYLYWKGQAEGTTERFRAKFDFYFAGVKFDKDKKNFSKLKLQVINYEKVPYKQ